MPASAARTGASSAAPRSAAAVHSASTAKPIWAKGGDASVGVVHAFTVGDDWQRDRVLAPYDLLGSLAHAEMLGATQIIPRRDADALIASLRDLHREFAAGTWTVEPDDEDVHSKVEALLTVRLGDAGKRLHTGRSRNDQVLTDLRLWEKDELVRLAADAIAAAAALHAKAIEHEFHPLPGYTHVQRGMPSSVGMFFAAHACGLLDDLMILDAAWKLADCCPLGSGASYGTGLPIDRALTARLLGFARHSQPAMADANSRGKVEGVILDACAGLMTDLGRLAGDLVFFTSQECGFFQLGAGFTTGSSIMPQKRNPDVFELIRARAARLLGLRTGLSAIVTGLPSGYSRDLQDTKPAVMDGLLLTRQALAITAAAAPTIAPVRERILAALTPDIYATDAAYRLVREQGISFREAYVRIGTQLDTLPNEDHDAVVRSRTHAGSTGNLGLPAITARIAKLRREWEGRRDLLHGTWAALRGEPPEPRLGRG